MAKFEILHNPRCGKSRTTLKLLEEAGIQPEVRLYLQDAPDAKELKSILAKLNISAQELIRKGEKVYKEHYKGKDLKEAEWIQAMVDHPILIERPIVIKGDQAVIGRPPENVMELI